MQAARKEDPIAGQPESQETDKIDRAQAEQEENVQNPNHQS